MSVIAPLSCCPNSTLFWVPVLYYKRTLPPLTLYLPITPIKPIRDQRALTEATFTVSYLLSTFIDRSPCYTRYTYPYDSRLCRSPDMFSLSLLSALSNYV